MFNTLVIWRLRDGGDALFAGKIQPSRRNLVADEAQLTCDDAMIF